MGGLRHENCGSPLIMCAEVEDQVSDATVDSFGRIILHEMLSVVPPSNPHVAPKWGIADQVIQTPQSHWR